MPAWERAAWVTLIALLLAGTWWRPLEYAAMVLAGSMIALFLRRTRR